VFYNQAFGKRLSKRENKALMKSLIVIETEIRRPICSYNSDSLTVCNSCFPLDWNTIFSILQNWGLGGIPWEMLFPIAYLVWVYIKFTTTQSILRFVNLSCVSLCLWSLMLLPQNSVSWLSEHYESSLESELSFTQARRGLRRFVLERIIFRNSAYHRDDLLSLFRDHSNPRVFHQNWWFWLGFPIIFSQERFLIYQVSMFLLSLHSSLFHSFQNDPKLWGLYSPVINITMISWISQLKERSLLQTEIFIIVRACKSIWNSPTSKPMNAQKVLGLFFRFS